MHPSASNQMFHTLLMVPLKPEQQKEKDNQLFNFFSHMIAPHNILASLFISICFLVYHLGISCPK